MSMLLLERYVIREILGPYLASLMASFFVLTVGRLVQLSRYILQTSATLTDLLVLILLALPRLSFYAIPMATILGVTLALNRLASDNEIMALQAAGINIKRLWRSFFVFAAVNTLVVSLVGVGLLHHSNILFRKKLNNIGASSVTALLQKGVFLDVVPGLIMYFQDVDARRFEVQGVYIEDFRSENVNVTVIARKAKVFCNFQQGLITLNIQEGTITRISKKDTAQVITFDEYTLQLFLGDLIAKTMRGGSSEKWEMNMAQLWKAAHHQNNTPEQRNRYGVEFYLRLIMPINCIIFSMVVVAFSTITYKREEKHYRTTTSFVISLIIFLLYYLMFSLGKALSEAQMISSLTAVAMPSCSFFFVFLYLWNKPYKRLTSKRNWLKRL